MTNNVIRIVEYKSRETVEALETMLEMARAGEISGMVFALRLGDWNHGVGVTGEYEKDPIAAASVAARILKILGNRADKMVRPGVLKRVKPPAAITPIKKRPK